MLNPQFTLGNDSRDWALAGPLYEHKEFSPDGRYLTYASFAEAENYDSFELDLATGERRRFTPTSSGTRTPRSPRTAAGS